MLPPHLVALVWLIGAAGSGGLSCAVVEQFVACSGLQLYSSRWADLGDLQRRRDTNWLVVLHYKMKLLRIIMMMMKTSALC